MSRAPVVVLAPDSFKGSLTAAQVRGALAEGLLAAAPDVHVVEMAVADGGEGTVTAVVEHGWQPISATVSGPWGDPVPATWARQPDTSTALVELAEASGIALAPALVPSRPADGPTRALTASTRGTGELVISALDHGCRRIVLGLGGSATNDGGAGMLAALGVRLLGPDGQPVPDGVEGLESLAEVDLSGLDARLTETEVVLANDVDNPLLGELGAAVVFAPQKGADEQTVARIDAALARWAHLLDAALGTSPNSRVTTPGAGAAGGTGYAVLAALGAGQVPGVELLLDLVGMDTALAGADLVVTGEGRLDEQTLSGKAPMGVLARARAHGIRTVAVAGHCALSPAVAREVGFTAVHALTDIEPDVERCLAEPGPLLGRIGATLADHLP
ncbi:glycerate kinase [Ornithinimicrobium sp. F0845]|uniref:glycerate kinase n=1 Tax=Ornithinimicrobium sp. F0845 TaxID=2926412 RepID=UPI001FF61EA2|nr:glycerate kinase [Ornithinimicrobium sp. F0845]MCK0112832.1 glycerate kinase [Ornithinimicrobium sp. F0845]